jgi:hypothetical protein
VIILIVAGRLNNCGLTADNKFSSSVQFGFKLEQLRCLALAIMFELLLYGICPSFFYVLYYHQHHPSTHLFIPSPSASLSILRYFHLYLFGFLEMFTNWNAPNWKPPKPTGGNPQKDSPYKPRKSSRLSISQSASEQPYIPPATPSKPQATVRSKSITSHSNSPNANWYETGFR